MKRLVSLLLITIMLCSGAFADEILFRGIPWGSNVNYVDKAMGDCISYSIDGIALSTWNETINSETAYRRQPCGWNSTYVFQDDTKVAGYDVTAVLVQHTYGIENGETRRSKEDAQMFAAEYMLDVSGTKAAYEDLKGKLTGLYGNGKENPNFPVLFYERAESTVWYGENNTAVLLLHEIAPDREDYPLVSTVTIKYWKTDYDRVIHELDRLVEQETLEQEALSRNNSTDGL